MNALPTLTSGAATSRPLVIALILAAAAAGIGFAAAKHHLAAPAPGVAVGTPPAVATSAPNAPLTPDAVRAAVPPVADKTPTEKEVTKCLAKTKISPANPLSWTNLGDALMQLVRERADQHNVAPAENAYRYALTLNPKSPDALTGMAWVTGNRHQFDQSVDWAKQSIAVRPNDSAPYGLMGDAQVEGGDYDGAYITYQKMLDIRPDLSSYSRGAHLLFITGDTRKAIWLMDKAVKAGGPYAENTAWCRAQLAEMLWSLGAVLPAESVVNAGLKTAPANPFLLVMEGRIRLARRDLPGAVAAAEKAVAAGPQHVPALVLAHDVYVRAGDKTKAELMVSQIEAAAAHYKAHGNADQLFLAKFYADNDLKPAEALAMVDEKTANGTADIAAPAVADIAAWVYYKNGRQAEAQKYIAQARRKGVFDAAKLYHAGMIAQKSGDTQEGRLLLYKALSENPNFDALQAEVASKTLTALGSAPLSGTPAGAASTTAKENAR